MKIINFNNYIPKYKDEFIIHRNIIELLEKNISNEMQHILLYGPRQSGKKTLLYALLRKIYNLDKNFSFLEEEIETNIFMIKDKNFIKITIENKVNINEKFKEIISNIIDLYYNHKIVYSNNNIQFKLLIIENAHYLNQTSINYICKKMEKNTEFRRFIILSKTSYKLNKINNNCNNIRIPLPNNEVIQKYYDNILLKEDINLTEHKYNYILSNSKQNIITLNLLLQNYLIDKKFKVNPNIIDINIESIIKIIKSTSIPKHVEITNLIIHLLDYGLKQKTIIKLLSKSIIENETDFDKCCDIVKITAEYDFKIKKISDNKLGIISYIVKLSSYYS